MKMKETHNLEIGDVEINLKSKFIPKINTYFFIPNNLQLNEEYELDKNAAQTVLNTGNLIGIHNGLMVYLEFNHIEDNVFILKGFHSINEKD